MGAAARAQRQHSAGLAPPSRQIRKVIALGDYLSSSTHGCPARDHAAISRRLPEDWLALRAPGAHIHVPRHEEPIALALEEAQQGSFLIMFRVCHNLARELRELERHHP